MNAISDGDEDGDGTDEGERDASSCEGKRTEGLARSFDSRAQKCKVSARGVAQSKSVDDMTEHVGNMSRAICTLV